VRYISTRGSAPALSFDEVLLAGLARDGGLYVPEAWPQFSAEEIRAMRGLSYDELAVRVMRPFVAGAIDDEVFAAAVKSAYRTFGHSAVTPLVQLDRQHWLLELHHGPTLAFKDVALQLLGRLFDIVLAKRGERVTVVGATSGDTGSAALEACRDRDRVNITILYPHGRVSEVQRRQMTTVDSANAGTVAIEGTFDDCQDMVKAMFADAAFRDETNLSAVNSINWARVMAQIVYYFAAALQLGAPDRPVAFAVPTGNFGNVYAAYGARAMGLPIARLVVGTNSNDILDRFFRTGTMRTGGVTPTLSPSMDIQISSNFERLLFDLFGRDGGKTDQIMRMFRSEGWFGVTAGQLAEAREIFASARCDDETTRAVIAATHRNTGLVVDPHTAVGLAAAGSAQIDRGIPVVTLACAHPAKFPDAVEAATGLRPGLPARVADLFDRPERITVMKNDLKAVQEHVRRFARGRAAA